MNTLIMTNMFKQAFSFAQTAEEKSIRLRVAPQLYAETRASSFAEAAEDKVFYKIFSNLHI